ncbi:MAG: excinuclease ABC subunit B [Candidatus Marinimicrobia bacterium]|nr:excinuclease ABC subunit B [Candidatus Neomarinimicrobiota bacterium]
MAEFKIKSDFSPSGDQPQAISSLVDGLNSNTKSQVLLGITGSGKTFTMANVIEKIQKPTLILSHNKTLAAQLYGEFKALFPDNAVEFFISYYDYYQPEAYLPVTDTFIEKDSSVNEEIDRLRLKATTSLMSRDDVIIIASVSSIYGIGSPDSYKDMLVEVNLNDKIELNSFFKKLVNIHYNRNDMVLEPGLFRSRGDTIEIFPMYETDAVRVEFFDDEVDRISIFDPMTMKVKQDLDRYYIYPAKHFVTTRENINRAIEDIRTELHPRLADLRKADKLLEAQRLEQRTLFDIEMMMELGYCSGIENYSRHIDGRKPGERPFTLMDYFPEDFLFFVDESHVSIPQVKAMYNGDRSRKESLIEYGFRLPSALDNRPLKFQEFNKLIDKVIYVSATPAEYELEQAEGEFVEQIIRPTGLLDPKIMVVPTEGQIDYLIEQIKNVIKNNERILVTTLTKKMAEDLTDYLKGVGIRAEYMHSEIDTIERVKIIRSLRLNEFDVLIGINLLREGLDLPEVSLIAVLDADKQGFLRSKSSLMQVAGRAARNVNGKVILFGDYITEAMQHLIDETAKRREVQKKYNKENGISPKTILKSIDQISLSTSVADEREDEMIKAIDSNDLNINFENMDKVEMQDLIISFERKMKKAAENMKFEVAAIYRDKIKELKQGAVK